jgi:hypothetical protein
MFVLPKGKICQGILEIAYNGFKGVFSSTFSHLSKSRVRRVIGVRGRRSGSSVAVGQRLAKVRFGVAASMPIKINKFT